MSEEAHAAEPPAAEKNASRPVRVLHPTDTVIAVIILAVGGALFYISTRFEEVSSLFAQNVPPAFFPQLVLITIALFTIALPFEHRFLRRSGKDIDADRRDRIRPIAWFTVALLVAVTAAAEQLGTFLTMIAVCALLPPLWGERRLLRLTLFALGFPTAVALLFNVVLSVYFQPGVFGISFR